MLFPIGTLLPKTSPLHIGCREAFLLLVVAAMVLVGCGKQPRETTRDVPPGSETAMKTDKQHPGEKSSFVKLLCTTNADHKPMSGSVADVADAVRRGADIRRFSTYNMKGTGLVEETMTLQTTWVFDDHHVGGLQTLRHPLDAGLGISMQPSMALWIFGVAAPQRSTFVPLNGQPMAHATGKWVNVDNEPYSAEAGEFTPRRYQWWARSDWKQICDHDQNGNPSQGSWEDIRKAVNDGGILKVGIKNLWSHLTPAGEQAPEHEVFIECTTDFSHVDEKFVGVLTQPTFLLQPRVPLKFSGENFALGWLVVRTDGKVQRHTLNPTNMQWEQKWNRYAVRWFTK